MTKPKKQHYVPRFYLRRFASHQLRLAFRRRDGAEGVASIKNLMVYTYLYDIPGTPHTAEGYLGTVESEASQVMEQLDEGDHYRSIFADESEEREVLSKYISTQYARTLAGFEMHMLLRDALRHHVDPTSREEVRQFLTERRQSSPDENEVAATSDVLYVLMSDKSSLSDSTHAHLQGILQSALQAAPLIRQKRWSLEVSRKPLIITSDRPVVLWKPPSLQDTYKGVGLADATEVWFILDPYRMIVLRSEGQQRARRIGPERVHQINSHIARHCDMAIVTHPDNLAFLSTISLSRNRPTLRINKGPAVDEFGRSLDTEILQIWRPIRDETDKPNDALDGS